MDVKSNVRSVYNTQLKRKSSTIFSFLGPLEDFASGGEGGDPVRADERGARPSWPTWHDCERTPRSDRTSITRPPHQSSSRSTRSTWHLLAGHTLHLLVDMRLRGITAPPLRQVSRLSLRFPSSHFHLFPFEILLLTGMSTQN